MATPEQQLAQKIEEQQALEAAQDARVQQELRDNVGKQQPNK